MGNKLRDTLTRLHDDMGLTLGGDWSMAYGWGYGHLRWTPYWLRKFICGVWNTIRCRIVGHDPFSYKAYTTHVIPGAPVCFNCCAKLKIDGKYPTKDEIKIHNELCEKGWLEAEEKFRQNIPEDDA